MKGMLAPYRSFGWTHQQRRSISNQSINEYQLVFGRQSEEDLLQLPSFLLMKKVLLLLLLVSLHTVRKRNGYLRLFLTRIIIIIYNRRSYSINKYINIIRFAALSETRFAVRTTSMEDAPPTTAGFLIRERRRCGMQMLI